MVDVPEIEKRTDLVRTAGIPMAPPSGSIISANVADLIKVAELYSRSGVMVPPHCRDRPGTCFALCKQAADWGIPDLAVMNKSYVVNNRGVERIAYESQLIHAIIEKNAPLKGRLRYDILGEGDERRCKVYGTFKGETKPHEYLSETLGKLRDARGRNDQGQVKGSPLWEQLPEVQLFYSASRQWARLFCPDVILGIYTPEDPGFEPRDVTPVTSFATRLEEAKKARAGGKNFDATKVNAIIEGDINPEVVTKEAEDEGTKGSGSEPEAKGRHDNDGDRADGDHGAAGRSGPVDSDPADVTAPVGDAAPAEGKANPEAAGVRSKVKAQGKRK